MNLETAWNMFVFRDGRNSVPGATLARDLADALRQLYASPSTGRKNQWMDALLRAGEFECALADAEFSGAASVSSVTDALADTFVLGNALRDGLLRMIPEDPPEVLKVSPPEGFAYYALHPLDYSSMAFEMPFRSGTACVIGIRSIGATLSALVATGLRQRGIRTVRFTVRPSGHPYERCTAFDEKQAGIVRNMTADTEFVVVDEGPGMSGSSFLSVGDALVESGVSRERITFLCSRVPDPDSLRAPHGGERWRSFRTLYAKKNSRLPDDAKLYIGGGDWRPILYGNKEGWPASWTQMERLKFLSGDRRVLFKFEGFGRFGMAVNERARRIADAGFGPRPLDFDQGFSAYPMIEGRSAMAHDLDSSRLSGIAAYCAFRAREFRCDFELDTRQLETMVSFNCSEEFGVESVLESGALACAQPVLVDGRMMPHEYVISRGNQFKVDAASHGDDHFFPGPTDIAWDLAGAIVEWGMEEKASDYLIGEYERLTGDRVRLRLPAFELAYSVFRMGYCKMASAAMRGSDEESRLAAAYRRYRAVASAKLAGATESLAA